MHDMAYVPPCNETPPEGGVSTGGDGPLLPYAGQTLRVAAGGEDRHVLQVVITITEKSNAVDNRRQTVARRRSAAVWRPG